MMDPVNTTADDGAACEVCGEDATGAVTILGRAYPVPLCTDCQYDEIATCPVCLRTIWQAEGKRIVGRELYCNDCHSIHPAIVGPIMAAIKAGEE